MTISPFKRLKPNRDAEHRRYLVGELARDSQALQFLCKDVDDRDALIELHKAIDALERARQIIAASVTPAPPRGTSSPTS